MAIMKCGRFVLDLVRPKIMAIVNVTPDSFSGDGLGHDVAAAVARAEAAIDAGADIIDLGGESTRPGSESVSQQEELDRVIPVVEQLARASVPVSVDTVKPAVMRAAIDAGAAMINDINAFREPGALDAIRASGVGLCIMHMQGVPRSMQHRPEYQDVVSEVLAFVLERAAALRAVGVEPEQISLDPGFGFGKTLDHNVALMKALPRFADTGYPVLIGVSRKSMLGQLTGRAVGERQFASVAAAMLAVEAGARIVRVHDVAGTRDALCIWEALRSETPVQ